MVDQLYSIKEAAKTLGVAPRTVWRIIAEGKLPQPIKIGRSSRLVASDIQNYIDALKKQRIEV